LKAGIGSYFLAGMGTFGGAPSTYIMKNNAPYNMNRDPKEEQKLITLCQEGNIEALERLYRCFSQDVYNMALRMTGSSDIAEEVTQEVFISVFKDIWRFQFQSSFTTWLYRIVMRRSADFFRKNKHHLVRSVDWENSDQHNPPFEIDDPGPNPCDVAFENEREQLIEYAILSLSKKQRTILLLRYVQNLSYEEIAGILRCRLGTVKSRLNRAHRSLERKLSEMKII
jgi:RNA polymerase sigma-70 factor (ECF subfamily)